MDSPSTNVAAHYNDTVVRQFSIMAVVWGVVGMLVGVFIAAQLAWPELNFGIPWLSYGRLRPLHTNAVIFAFGGSALFATSYYVVQRTCQTRLFAGPLAAFTFWGWQLVIVAAAVSLPLGYTTGKEYAELEWPIDILIALVWVSYAIVFFGTVGTRINGAAVPSSLTTPEAPDLQALLATMLERGVDTVVMEVSSHALRLGRVAGVSFAVGGFTNLSQDHLDFHPTMEDYFDAKSALFDPASPVNQ
mgnify:CR=1 FL=1